MGSWNALCHLTTEGSRKEKGLEKKQGLTELGVDWIIYLYAREWECLIKVDEKEWKLTCSHCGNVDDEGKPAQQDQPLYNNKSFISLESYL